jgi:hypothetical protein
VSGNGNRILHDGDDIEVVGTRTHLSVWIGLSLVAEGSPTEVYQRLAEISTDLSEAREAVRKEASDVATA